MRRQGIPLQNTTGGIYISVSPKRVETAAVEPHQNSITSVTTRSGTPYCLRTTDIALLSTEFKSMKTTVREYFCALAASRRKHNVTICSLVERPEQKPLWRPSSFDSVTDLILQRKILLGCCTRLSNSSLII